MSLIPPPEERSCTTLSLVLIPYSPQLNSNYHHPLLAMCWSSSKRDDNIFLFLPTLMSPRRLYHPHWLNFIHFITNHHHWHVPFSVPLWHIFRMFTQFINLTRIYSRIFQWPYLIHHRSSILLPPPISFSFFHDSYMKHLFWHLNLD